jgi:variant SH3 domain-containing protein/SH3 domain-containing protein
MRTAKFTPRLARAARDYSAQYSDPIEVAADALVDVEREDHDNPGWWWCVGPDARAGWVPAELIDPAPRCGARARVRAAYSARELSMTSGDTLFVLGEYAGWMLLQNSLGVMGWAPSTHVRYVMSS